MKRSRICLIILLLFSLVGAPASARQDDDRHKLRDELVKARLENLTLKLRLARLSGKPEEELKILEETLDADLPELDVRVAALETLGVAKREPAVGPLAASLSTEKDPLILERTVDALGAIGSSAATDALVRLLAATTRETIRWSCINSLGKIGDAKAGPSLLSFLE